MNGFIDNDFDMITMYPDEYEILFPEIKKVVKALDKDMSDMPPYAQIEEMTDMVYENTNGKLAELGYETQKSDTQVSQYYEFGYPGYGFFGGYPRRRRDRRTLREIIELLLVRELFRRRRRPILY